MTYSESMLEAIGETPLVKLSKLPKEGSAQVLVKCEFLNPTGSIKDRMAYYIISEAEKRGEIKPGCTIVENTSGNTGLGLAMVAAAKGYRCIFTMPDKMSTEKINMLKAFGAEVVITPTDVPGDSPYHYVETAKRIARETPNSFYVNQYHNPLNTEAHEKITGPEIWRQTEGKFNAFVAGLGTGGTTSGVGRYLKSKDPSIRIVGVDPIGSVHYDLFYNNTLVEPHVYKVEGIGEDIKCEALDFSVLDEIRQVNDEQCFLTARRLVREEGIFCGGSSGGNVYIALQLAEELGEGHTVVTVLPDSATRYVTKFLSDSWMVDNGFLPRKKGLGTAGDVLEFKGKGAVTVYEDEKLKDAIALMKQHSYSLLPVLNRGGQPVGVIHEIDILKGITSGRVDVSSEVSTVAKSIQGTVSPESNIEDLYEIFDRDNIAIMMEGERLLGVITEIDVIEYLVQKEKERVN
ncbi:MAG: pyridoxal-phosphate dependent enzyme [Candidatus Dadabacteria bacterium]|nr:MAG: pyridoxal-phosphate dependent enzyme [Candidatus Dadabacteria bacterium]